MNILVIGGNRFVGKKLVVKLLSQSHEVTVLNRSASGPEGSKKIKFDRNNCDDYDYVNFNEYDCIVDMCLFKPEQFELIKNKISEKVNYIFVSSGAVDYIDTNSFGDYAIEKMEVEKAISNTNLNYKIIRPSYIVGMGNHRPRLGYYIAKLKNGENISIDGNGEYPINLVFANDVVQCLLKLIYEKNKTCETYNVCGDESITINNLIKLLKDELDVVHHKVINTSDSLFPNQSFEFSNDKIKSNYSISFTKLKDGIKQYIKEYNEF